MQSEKANGAAMPTLSQRIPAIMEAGRLHRPTTIWNPPRTLALYSAGASSVMIVFSTGS
jgi:hypothetical protein